MILTIQSHVSENEASWGYLGGISGFLVPDGNPRGPKYVIQRLLRWVRKTHEGVGYGYQLRPPQHDFYIPKQCL